MPILTNEREAKRGRRSWIPAVLAGVPLLLLAALVLLALLVPLDGEPLVIPLGGANGPALAGSETQPAAGSPAVRPRWYTFAYRRKMRSGVTVDVYGVNLGYRTWLVVQPRR